MGIVFSAILSAEPICSNLLSSHPVRDCRQWNWYWWTSV